MVKQTNKKDTYFRKWSGTRTGLKLSEKAASVPRKNFESPSKRVEKSC